MVELSRCDRPVDTTTPPTGYKIPFRTSEEGFGGADRDRTDDLLNAIPKHGTMTSA